MPALSLLAGTSLKQGKCNSSPSQSALRPDQSLQILRAVSYCGRIESVAEKTGRLIKLGQAHSVVFFGFVMGAVPGRVEIAEQTVADRSSDASCACRKGSKASSA